MDTVIAALVAGIVSIFISLTSNIIQSRQFKKSIDRMFTDRLYNLRIEHYPQAFEITEKILRKKKPTGINDRDELLQIKNDLVQWKRGAVSLSISGQSLSLFRELVDALGMGYALTDKYSDEQIDKIMTLRHSFRRQLRKDIGHLYNEDYS